MERFRVEVAEEVLEDLRERLARTRFPDQVEGAGWAYGTELSYLKERLLEHLAEEIGPGVVEDIRLTVDPSIGSLID